MINSSTIQSEDFNLGPTNKPALSSNEKSEAWEIFSVEIILGQYLTRLGGVAGKEGR